MNKEIARKWYKQALHDLDIAEKNIQIKGYDVAAFLCHQAVEKLLKSIYAFQNKSIPRIHYVDELAKKIDFPKDILNKIIDLTGDYTISRYPDVSDTIPYEQYNKSIASSKVKKAKAIFNFVRKKYKKLIPNKSDSKQKNNRHS